MMLLCDGEIPQGTNCPKATREELEALAASQRRLIAEMGADRFHEIKGALIRAKAAEAEQSEARAKESRRIEIERKERLRTA